MSHSEVYKWFELYFPQYAGDKVESWFQNGKNSIRIRQKNHQEFIFTFNNEGNWRFVKQVEFELGAIAYHCQEVYLSNAGTDHRKFMRMLPVYVRITAPLYWWKEFDTYKVGTVANSCSTMHKIASKEFTLDDFSCEHIHIRQSTDVLKETIDALNVFRDVYLNGGILSYENGNQRCYGKNDKEIWWQMIQLLPSSYNQTRNVMMNYEVLANIYKSRKDHKLDEWRNFCKWIEEFPYSELITGGTNEKMA